MAANVETSSRRRDATVPGRRPGPRGRSRHDPAAIAVAQALGAASAAHAALLGRRIEVDDPGWGDCPR
ncbi:hypothetical protein [Jatrophihabitans endophyticus]|uniref:hypothetical protein n=1 Tax=Jatrophihabitans endophyticus TaxID=1206085 RepID=UPI000932B8F6|nr:hypothetical protein [Jatrophihabitans endophyticus]